MGPGQFKGCDANTDERVGRPVEDANLFLSASRRHIQIRDSRAEREQLRERSPPSRARRCVES